MPKTTEVDPKDIKKLRDEGLSWAAVAEKAGVSAGKCMFLYEIASTNSKNRITGGTDAELKKAIAKARKEGLSWGIIAARSGQTVGYCQSAYEEVSGKPALGDRVGKGGRLPSGMKSAAKPVKSTAKKATAKKAAAKKSSGSDGTKTAKKSSGAVKKAAKKAPAKKAAAKKSSAKKATASSESAS